MRSFTRIPTAFNALLLAFLRAVAIADCSRRVARARRVVGDGDQRVAGRRDDGARRPGFPGAASRSTIAVVNCGVFPAT